MKQRSLLSVRRRQQSSVAKALDDRQGDRRVPWQGRADGEAPGQRLPPKVWFDLPHAADGGAAVAGLWAGHGMAGRKPGSVTSDHLDHVRRAGQLPSEGKTASSPPWAPLLNSNPPSKNSHRRSAANWRPDMRNARHCSTPPTRSSNPTTMRSRPSESGAAWRAADRPCPARWFKQRGLAR